MSLSWARWIQYIASHSIYFKIHFNNILPSMCWSSYWFPYKNCLCISPHPWYMPPLPGHRIRQHLITHKISNGAYKGWSSSLCSFLQFRVASSVLGWNNSSAACSQTSSAYVLPWMCCWWWGTVLEYHVHELEKASETCHGYGAHHVFETVLASIELRRCGLM
jgi:hypothetical protein